MIRPLSPIVPRKRSDIFTFASKSHLVFSETPTRRLDLHPGFVHETVVTRSNIFTSTGRRPDFWNLKFHKLINGIARFENKTIRSGAFGTDAKLRSPSPPSAGGRISVRIIIALPSDALVQFRSRSLLLRCTQNPKNRTEFRHCR
jgi:hypothetical protein